MGWGVITSCGVRWIESCGNLEDVASLRMLFTLQVSLLFTEGAWRGCNNVMWSALD